MSEQLGNKKSSLLLHTPAEISMKTMDIILEILIRLVNTMFIQQNNCYTMVSAVMNFCPCLQQHGLPLVKLASVETRSKNKVV